MGSLLRRLWADDQGSVLSSELVLIMAVVTVGSVPMLVQIRQGVRDSVPDIAAIVKKTVEGSTGEKSATVPVRVSVKHTEGYPAP